MKTKNTILYLLFFCLLIVSCDIDTVKVSDEISTIQYDFTGINDLEVASDFKAYVTFSDTNEEVRIQANSNLLDKIVVNNSGGKLEVRLKNNVNIRGRQTLNLFITTREIIRFKASSDSEIRLETPLETGSAQVNLSSDAFFSGAFMVDDFRFKASSDSSADILVDTQRADIELSSDAYFEGELNADEVYLDATSDSDINLIGTANTLDASLSSDSKLRDYGFQVEDLKISLTSDSQASLTVDNTIDVTARSDSRLFYKGDAAIVYVDLSGDSKVIKK